MEVTSLYRGSTGWAGAGRVCSCGVRACDDDGDVSGHGF